GQRGAAGSTRRCYQAAGSAAAQRGRRRVSGTPKHHPSADGRLIAKVFGENVRPTIPRHIVGRALGILKGARRRRPLRMRRWNHLQKKFRRKSALALMAPIAVTFSFAHSARADANSCEIGEPRMQLWSFV